MNKANGGRSDWVMRNNVNDGRFGNHPYPPPPHQHHHPHPPPSLESSPGVRFQSQPLQGLHAPFHLQQQGGGPPPPQASPSSTLHHPTSGIRPPPQQGQNGGGHFFGREGYVQSQRQCYRPHAPYYHPNHPHPPPRSSYFYSQQGRQQQYHHPRFMSEAVTRPFNPAPFSPAHHHHHQYLVHRNNNVQDSNGVEESAAPHRRDGQHVIQKTGDGDEEYVPVPVRPALPSLSTKMAIFEIARRSPKMLAITAAEEDAKKTREDEHIIMDEEAESPPSLAISHDDEGEDDAQPEKTPVTLYVSTARRYVLIGKQKTELKVAYGIWGLTEGRKIMLSGLLPSYCSQVCLKVGMISGTTTALKWLKEKGIMKATVMMESNFIVKNIPAWSIKHTIGHFNRINTSNWDEYKYLDHISELCGSLEGMKINWVHVAEKCRGFEEAKRLAMLALPSDCSLFQNSINELLELQRNNKHTLESMQCKGDIAILF